MFALTDDACLIVKAVAARTAGGRAEGGVRISSGAHAAAHFAIDPVAAASPGDVTVEQAGARAFLAAEVVDALAESVLDASIDRAGVVSFSIGTVAQERPEGMTAVRSTGPDPAHGHVHGH